MTICRVRRSEWCTLESAASDRWIFNLNVNVCGACGWLDADKGLERRTKRAGETGRWTGVDCDWVRASESLSLRGQIDGNRLRDQAAAMNVCVGGKTAKDNRWRMRNRWKLNQIIVFMKLLRVCVHYIHHILSRMFAALPVVLSPTV